MPAIYSTEVTSTGGRDGHSTSNDNRLSVALSTPKELGGAGGDGTNPEQLFGAGYSACFIGAMKFVAAQQKLSLPSDTAVTALIGIGQNENGPGFAIDATLEIALPGLPEDQAKALIETSHQVCPYSNATRNNVDVKLKLV